MEQNQLGLDLRVHGTVDSLTSLENRFSTWYTSKYGIDAYDLLSSASRAAQLTF